MVCAKCEAKLPKLVVADKWKHAATKSSSGPVRGGAARRVAPPAAPRPCRACKGGIHLAGASYCQSCAYKNGICAMCGTRVLAIDAYKMSSR